VVVTMRRKLACYACTGVVPQAPAPDRLIGGNVPTEATFAHALVSRYADHLPSSRQSQSLALQGIEIGREVLAGWAGTAALDIVPVVRRLHGSCSARCVCLPPRPRCRCSTPAAAGRRKAMPGRPREAPAPASRFR